MSFLSPQVGLVRLVAVTIGMNACVPRFVSLPSNLRADAQQSEYRTSAFTVRAPHGRWATDSVMSLRNLKVLWRCENPYDSIDLAGLVEAYTDFGGNRTPLHVEQIRFYRVVKMQALRAWLVLRGTEPGPLFGNVDRARKGRRLTTTSVYRMVRALGVKVGLVVRPHGLRHAAITAALDLTGDLRAVRRFSRHKDVRVLTVYDDNRADLGGEVARRVAAQA